ncbi:MAG: hypothetical protein WAV54_14745 [Acidimicrobiales bacterium]
MNKERIGETLAEALIAGAEVPEGMPTEWCSVAQVFEALRNLPTPQPGPNEAELTAAMSAVVRGTRKARTSAALRRAGKITTLKVAIVGAVFVGATAAAAATGTLPGPVQHVFAHALAHVGVSIPSGSSATTPPQHGSTRGTHVSSVTAPGCSALQEGRQGCSRILPHGRRRTASDEAKRGGDTCRSRLGSGNSIGGGRRNQGTTHYCPSEPVAHTGSGPTTPGNTASATHGKGPVKTTHGKGKGQTTPGRSATKTTHGKGASNATHGKGKGAGKEKGKSKAHSNGAAKGSGNDKPVRAKAAKVKAEKTKATKAKAAKAKAAKAKTAKTKAAKVKAAKVKAEKTKAEKAKAARSKATKAKATKAKATKAKAAKAKAAKVKAAKVKATKAKVAKAKAAKVKAAKVKAAKAKAARSKTAKVKAAKAKVEKAKAAKAKAAKAKATGKGKSKGNGNGVKTDSRTPYIGQAFMPMTWEHPPLFDQDVRESL